jgi:syntaxin-binding protein 1
MRIMALYIWYRDGVPEEDLRRLFEHARLTKDEKAAVQNIGRLGLRVTRVRAAMDNWVNVL